jgi:prepilin-type N-terminal cleavage/methylation domain-containing protein
MNRCARAFTLIELMAVMAIMGILAMGVMVSVGTLDFARLKTASSQVAGAVRYLQNLAVLNNTYYRLVVDLGSGKYHGEEIKLSDSLCTPFRTVGEDEEKPESPVETLAGGGPIGPPGGAGGDSGSGSGPGSGSGSGAGDGAGPGPGPDEAPPPPEARPQDHGEKIRGVLKGRKDNLLSKRELGPGLKFSALASEFRQDAKTEGSASILFYPDGTIEKAFLYIESADETYTVVTYPAMGTARVFPEKLDEGDLKLKEGD